MFAVIGIGGAGGNVANYASKLGYQSGAINFSQKDLDSADNVELKIKLVGSEGVGHNRDEAIRLMANNWENAVKFVEDNFMNPSTDVILVPFSTGGGSGSGIAPLLLDILSQSMDKTFVAMPILPDNSEAIVSQINSLKTFEELSKLDVAVFPIDNQIAKDKNTNIGKNMIFETTNKYAISSFDQLISYTDKFSKNGNIDRKDILTILGTRGFGTISEIDISKLSPEGNNLSVEGISSKIIQSWNESIFAPIETDKIIRAGIIFDGQEYLMQYLNHELIFENFGSGMPIDVFEGNYHENGGKIISILSGLTVCRSRLKQIENIVNDKKGKAELALDNSDQEFTSTVSSFGNIMSKPKQSKKKIGNVGEILSKYKR